MVNNVAYNQDNKYANKIKIALGAKTFYFHRNAWGAGQGDDDSLFIADDINAFTPVLVDMIHYGNLYIFQ